MAIVGKHNVLQLIEINKTPYWRLYENSNKRQNGNYIDQADFDESGVDIAVSKEKLRRCLDMLSTGTYLLVAYTTRDKNKGGIDTLIEVEGLGGRLAAIGGTGANEFVVEGIGKITPENFKEAIKAEVQKVQEEAQRKQELTTLKQQVADLKKQAAENEGGFNKGIMAIGAIAYDHVSKTPAGKEFIGIATKALFGSRQETNGTVEGTAEAINGRSVVVNGTEPVSEEDRVTTALERLSENNPEFIGQLEKLAKLKETDPDTFQVAVSSLDGM